MSNGYDQIKQITAISIVLCFYDARKRARVLMLISTNGYRATFYRKTNTSLKPSSNDRVSRVQQPPSEVPFVVSLQLGTLSKRRHLQQPQLELHCFFAAWAMDEGGLYPVGVFATRSFDARFVFRRLATGFPSGSPSRKFSSFASAGHVPRDPEDHR